MQLNWIKCKGDVWCKLNSVNLDHEHFNNRYGVYIIWHGGANPRVVYVGQGNIKDCIEHHRQNPDVQKYEHLGLYVTWARVSDDYINNAKAYLADKWDPIVSEHHSQAPPTEVNSPWSS